MPNKGNFAELARELVQRLDPAGIPDDGVLQFFTSVHDGNKPRTICVMLWDIERVSVEKLRRAVSEGEPVEEGTYSEPFGFLHRLLFRQKRRGGAPKGIRSKTRDEYLALANWYYKTGLSQREFCREIGISRRKLNRALRFAQKFVPENRGGDL